MGNCFCQLHIHQDQNDLINKMEQPPENNNSNSFFPKDLNSQLSNNSLQIKLKNPKTNKLELNIKTKLLELGHFIQYNDFKRLMGNEIVKIIQEEPFDYKKYISPPKIFPTNLNPFQFRESNDIYFGSWNQEAEMEGKGIYYSYDKKITIEGFWVKGDNICGRIFFTNKAIYQGEIMNSMPNGQGELFKGNQDRFIGTFKNGEIEKGVFIFGDDKTKYEGFFENGNFNGEGKMTWGNIIEYQGYFKNSMFSGKGKITLVIDIDKKEEYEGDFNENEFHGKGKYCFNNGDIYEGDFEFGIKKGHGIYYRNDGDKIQFEGKWDDDFPNGNGVLTYNGYKLKGFWRNGDYMSSPEEENEIFNDKDKNIKPYKISIFPSTLSHLNIGNSNISQYSQDHISNQFFY